MVGGIITFVLLIVLGTLALCAWVGFVLIRAIVRLVAGPGVLHPPVRRGMAAQPLPPPAPPAKMRRCGRTGCHAPNEPGARFCRRCGCGMCAGRVVLHRRRAAQWARPAAMG